MLEKPDLPDARVAACLRDAYALNVVQLDFLPLGADRDTAIYRAIAEDGIPYFVKLRGGVFDEMTLSAPRLFSDRGIRQVIAPLPTRSQQLWTDLDDFKLAAFPFVEGRDGYDADLQDHHWVDLGHTLKAIHMTKLPAGFRDRLRREDYTPRWRERVRWFQQHVQQRSFADGVSAQLVALLMDRHREIEELVNRAEDLAAVLQRHPRPFLLCHADIHAGNVLIDGAGRLFVVDWDTLLLAPQERDLMFVGGGQFGDARSPQEEEALFYQGYGPAEIDGSALVYYRCERIVEDIAAYCEQILLAEHDGPDREEGLQQLTSQFDPGNVVEIALSQTV
jgi:spectinomycin phosphotransferase